MSDSTTPMRIVHTESSWGWGGQELRILAESAGMLRRGHDVHIVCPAHATLFAEAQRRDIPVTALPIEQRSLRALRALRGWLKKHHPDVVNTHSSTDSWLVALLGKIAGPRLSVVRTRHISAAVGRDLLTHWLYRHGTDFVVTTGERLRRALIENNGLAPGQVVSVPTGIDTDRFSPGDRDFRRHCLKLPLDATIIGIVATVRTAKGHHELIDAVHQIGRDDALLIIVGHGPAFGRVQLQVTELGMEHQVRLVGHQDDVVPWLQAIDLFALPSHAEGVPQAIVQAMSCGLPVVSTPVGAIEEAVVDGETGLIVPPRDATSLAEALVRLMDDPALRQRLGEAGRRRAIEKFGVEQMLDMMEQIFLQLCGRTQVKIAA